MKLPFLTSFLILAAASCLRCTAFANVVAATSRTTSAASFRPSKSSPSLQNNHALWKLRGGSDSELRGSMQDYSDAAGALFGNILGPASMLAGGMVPLGFLADPLKGDKKIHKRLRSIYMLVSIFSLANELIAIIYATVASNKLIETVSAPAASAFALIQRDYELSWIATNVHFMAGLLGFITMIALRAYNMLPANINKAGAGLATSFLLGMISVVNRGIHQGDKGGHVFATSIVSLAVRYFKLLGKEIASSWAPLSLAYVVLAFTSVGWAIKAIIQESDMETPQP